MKKLTKAFSITGKVITGNKVGHTIGFPTINLKLATPKPNLKPGVYVCICRLKQNLYLGLAYFGPRYISNKSTNSFEVHLFNFSRSIKTLIKKDISSLKNYVVLVNRQDQPLAIQSILKAHQKQGQLHRAVSVYLFNYKDQLLIQQRSKHKLLWPEIWANTCCSHPRINESYVNAAQRRLFEEFGIKAKLKLHTKFIYQASYNQIGTEHEIDAVLIGRSRQTPKPNQHEISKFKYINLDKLEKEFIKSPKDFAPWFKLGLKKLPASDILTS